jgi:hypothetical protein
MPLGHELPSSADEMIEIAVHVPVCPVPTAAMGLADMRGGHRQSSLPAAMLSLNRSLE